MNPEEPLRYHEGPDEPKGRLTAHRFRAKGREPRIQIEYSSEKELSFS
jgi:hypothetical protein